MTFCHIFEVASRVRMKVVDDRSFTEKCSVQEKKSRSAEDIGAIEVLLIDRLIDLLYNINLHEFHEYFNYS